MTENGILIETTTLEYVSRQKIMQQLLNLLKETNEEATEKILRDEILTGKIMLIQEKDSNALAGIIQKHLIDLTNKWAFFKVALVENPDEQKTKNVLHAFKEYVFGNMGMLEIRVISNSSNDISDMLKSCGFHEASAGIFITASNGQKIKPAVKASAADPDKNEIIARLEKSLKEENSKRIEAENKLLLLEKSKEADEIPLLKQEVDDLKTINRQLRTENKNLREELDQKSDQVINQEKMTTGSTEKLNTPISKKYELNSEISAADGKAKNSGDTNFDLIEAIKSAKYPDLENLLGKAITESCKPELSNIRAATIKRLAEVMRLLKTNGGITRKGLMENFSVSRVTVDNLIEILKMLGVIVSDGWQKNDGKKGRPQEILKFPPPKNPSNAPKIEKVQCQTAPNILKSQGETVKESSKEKPKKTLTQLCATPGLCEAHKEILVELNKTGGRSNKEILRHRTGMQASTFNSYLQYMQNLEVIEINGNVVSLIT